MILNDIKQIYPTFKWFKENYSILNKATRVLLCGLNNENIQIYYNQDSPYYLLYGEITANNIFSQWLSGKKTFLSLDNIILLHKCLKKNVKKIEYDDHHLILEFDGKDNVTHVVDMITYNEDDFCFKTNKIKNLLTTNIEFDPIRLTSEIFTPYIQNGDLIFKHEDGYEKILEHPSKKFICTQKDATYSLSFSDVYKNIRYVAVNSYTEKIKLMQLFATI